MKLEKTICPKCGRIDTIIPSNNNLVTSSCLSCLNEAYPITNVESLAFVSRTLNIGFNPSLYMSLLNENELTANQRYFELLDDQPYDRLTDVWQKIDEEWIKAKEFYVLMARVDSIKESFIERSRMKWGTKYSFHEFLTLENMFISTIKVYSINDSIQMDAVKKACKAALAIDIALETGEVKMMKDLTTSYQSFLKIAKIDELSETANENQIKTVSDLYKYMENNNFDFEFYDGVHNDIVDAAISDIKSSIRNEIVNATGLEHLLEEVKEKYFVRQEELQSEEVHIEEVPLTEMLDEDYLSQEQEMADKTMENEDVFFDY